MTDMNRRTNRNKDYQADFAQRLVNAVGYEAAVKECYENQWLGTLVYIQQFRRLHHA